MINFLFVTALAVVAIYDIKEKRIPNLCVLLIAVLAVIDRFISGRGSFASGMFDVLCVSTPLLMIAVITKGAFGGGDVKLLMVCAISIGRAMPRFLILSFICNGIYAVIFLWKRKNSHLRLFRLFQYVTQCKDNKRLLMYETENGDLMKDGMIHFSFGILAAYMICLLGGGL